MLHLYASGGCYYVLRAPWTYVIEIMIVIAIIAILVAIAISNIAMARFEAGIRLVVRVAPPS